MVILYMYTVYFEQVHPSIIFPFLPLSSPFLKVFGRLHYAVFEYVCIVYFDPLYLLVTSCDFLILSTLLDW
jgi:hypothetical protein